MTRRTLPAQRPGQSLQAVGTPPTFLDAVRQLLEIPQFSADLAASASNAVCPLFFCEEDNALAQSWDLGMGGWLWLNPPFGRLGPWVQKAYLESRVAAVQVAMLVPAGVGANWWRDGVDGKAAVRLLNGRLTFVGHTAPYPKDCALLLYASSLAPTYQVWDWRK